METQSQEVPRIERIDRYTITVNGHHVRATEQQERTVRAMDASAVARFLRIMLGG